MTRRVFVVLAGLSLLVAIGAAACGDDNNDSASTPTRAAPTTAATRAATAAVTPPASGATAAATSGTASPITVTAADFSFTPADLTAKTGSVHVTLNNTGSAPHTLTVYKDDAYTQKVDGADTGRVSGGASGQFTTNLAAGEYYFRCEVHPTQMKGELVVS